MDGGARCDLGGHLDFTRRARASTLSKRVRGATDGVAAVGALPLFQINLGLVRGKKSACWVYVVEVSYASASSLSALRGAIVRSFLVQ